MLLISALLQDVLCQISVFVLGTGGAEPLWSISDGIENALHAGIWCVIRAATAAARLDYRWQR